jgi:uncharacterized coiled-coil protein SlyX
VDDQYNEIDLSPQPVLRPRSVRIGALLAGLTALVVLAAACFVWLNFDRVTDAFLADAQSGAPPVLDQEVPLQDFLAFQQQTNESLEKINQDTAAQKAELKGLADQLSALSGKFDSLQSTIAAQAAPQPAAFPLVEHRCRRIQTITRVAFPAIGDVGSVRRPMAIRG